VLIKEGIVLLNVEEKSNVKIIKLSGRIDASNCDEYKESLFNEVQKGKKIVLCFGDLEFIDSSGMGVLVKMLRNSLDLGGEVVIVNLNYKTRLVFEITRANNLFNIYDSLDHALDMVA
jgi:anti-anti-sigma factor